MVEPYAERRYSVVAVDINAAALAGLTPPGVRVAPLRELPSSSALAQQPRDVSALPLLGSMSRSPLNITASEPTISSSPDEDVPGSQRVGYELGSPRAGHRTSCRSCGNTFDTLLSR